MSKLIGKEIWFYRFNIEDAANIDPQFYEPECGTVTGTELGIKNQKWIDVLIVDSGNKTFLFDSFSISSKDGVYTSRLLAIEAIGKALARKSIAIKESKRELEIQELRISEKLKIIQDNIDGIVRKTGGQHE